MKFIKKTGLALFLVVDVFFIADAQIKNDIMKHENLFEVNEYIPRHQHKIGFVGELFHFYKKYISSQDSHSCVFYPSCSSYAVEAVTVYGMLKGSLMAADRLTRCHPFSSDEYPKYKKTRYFYDPVH